MTAEYWVWLSLVLGKATDVVHNVVEFYGDAKAFYLADDKEKIAKCRLSKAQAERLHKVSRKTVYNILKDSAENGIRIVTPQDKEYPKRLWSIADPPCVLYIKGQRLELNDKPCIAIIGPRKVSDFGSMSANTIANSLASCGFIIVSGGAIGGDSAAHLGAIDVGGKTVAVLGGGILSGYLEINADLRNRIAENGCLISEDPPFEKVKRGTFPKRNRILSGISNGVVVVEGSLKSGTMLTAKHANEQGRDVFVIPGSPSLPQYEGSNRLLRDGAKPLLEINDIINEYLYIYPKAIHKPVIQKSLPTQSVKITEKAEQSQKSEPQSKDLEMLSTNAKIVYKAVAEHQNSVFYADDVIDKTGLDAGGVLAAMTELEIFGFVSSVPGGMYRKN